jgi:hypothetical protein
MEERKEGVLGSELVREMLARRERGESMRRIAQELGVDRKTVRWLRIGGWQPRQSRVRPRAIDGYVSFIEHRGPEVGWNGVVLLREHRGEENIGRVVARAKDDEKSDKETAYD